LGFDKYVPWIVVGVIAYFVVTKTTIIQNFASGLKGLGSGGGGGQTAQAQPQSAPAPSSSSTDTSTPSTSTPTATTSAPAPSSTTTTPTTTPTVTTTTNPPTVQHHLNPRQKGLVTHPSVTAPRAGNAPVSGKKKQPRNGTPPATPAATGALTTGSGRTLASTLTNAQMLAMGISSAGCPKQGVSSGGKHCYTVPGRHHCCPGKPSPPGSPSNAPGQSKCDCDA
jgi:hypothetical protein